jgi:MerR family Zn(II)-responsive transcriptional regulator of zntA
MPGKNTPMWRTGEPAVPPLDPGTGSRAYLHGMTSDLLLIGEVAARSGVSADTVRHYERKGLLQVERDGSGYRRYSAEAVGRIRVVRRALAIGFTLDELARIFRQRASGVAPCAGVRDLASRKLVQLDERIAAMHAVRAALAEIVTSWEQRLQITPAGGFAHLLDSLIE